MGSVRKYLYTTKLPDRERHHSRLFIDLAENIHIHHREYRTVFSLNEYFEYADIVAKSTEDVRNFLEQNPGYKEGEYPTTIMIAGGKERQLKFLDNSPAPNKSAYYDEEFSIELQDEFVTDEIHIHYRDFRIAMDRSRFRKVAAGFVEALDTLDNFEKTQTYNREYHPDHVVDHFNSSSDKEVLNDVSARLMGIKKIEMSLISSPWLDNGTWKADKEVLTSIANQFKKEGVIIPILLSSEKDGSHIIIDGHHRYMALKNLGCNSIDAVICDITFNESQNIRTAEALLKKFDIETNFEFGLSSFMKSYLAFRLNRFYASAFNKKMMKQSWYWRFARKIKRLLFGKKQFFRSFSEAHNHHN